MPKIRLFAKSYNILKPIFPFIAVIIFATSCATLFSGTKDRISFNSKPSGAVIYKDGVELCTTPCSYKVQRSLSDTDIEIKLDGYQTRLVTLDKEFNIVSVINLGNLFGWGIDALSGAVMKYDRKSYEISLTPNQTTSFIEPSKININTLQNTVDLFVQKKSLPTE
jgi:hypothetical protein